MAHKSDSVKRVYVYMEEKQHMDLKVRLDYHSIGMSEFVRACSEALLVGHPIMEQFMDHSVGMSGGVSDDAVELVDKPVVLHDGVHLVLIHFHITF